MTLSLYRPSSFLRDDLVPGVREQYAQRIGNFTQEGREKILIAMMKVNFLKRLESSIDSFRLTLARTIRKIDDLKTKTALNSNTCSTMRARSSPNTTPSSNGCASW